MKILLINISTILVAAATRIVEMRSARGRALSPQSAALSRESRNEYLMNLYPLSSRGCLGDAALPYDIPHPSISPSSSPDLGSQTAKVF
jgi:hypothetical protein